MNLPVAHNQLPPHLQALTQNTALMGMNAAASAGISSGSWPRISIKSSRFRLVTPQNEEFLVPSLHLDVIIVDANSNGISKTFYLKKWDPTGEGEAPDCFSDNGVGPSQQAAKPQCGTCAACPQNAWGSKISEASGKAIKACTDTKKLAVLIANNTSGPVFELRVPADSLKELGQYVKSLDKHGVPMSSVITRLTFDADASYPRLLFAPAFDDNGTMPYINAEQVKDVLEVIGTEEVDQCTGKNDRAIDATKILAAPAVAPAANPPTQFSQPVPVASVHTQFVQPQPPLMVPAAQLVVPSTPVQESAPKATRTRKPKNQADVPAVPAGGPTIVPELPPFLASTQVPQAPLPVSTNAVNATAPLVPAGVTNATLDDMLARALAV